MTTRRLRLTREVMTELTTTELGGIAGGSHLCAISDTCTHGASFDACPTLPINVCTTITSALIAPTFLC